MLKSIVFVVSLIGFNQAFAVTAIQIKNDEDRCEKGWLSMDVDVLVGSQSFHFEPDCKFSFEDHLRTEEGLTCELSAGMCSPFSPHQKFQVECIDGSSASISIRCPGK